MEELDFDAVALSCPYCGELAEVDVDPGGGEIQDFIQDCAVCCSPWSVHLERQEDGSDAITLRRDDE